MLMARIPIAVIMQRRAVDNPWIDVEWGAVGVVSNTTGIAKVQTLSWAETHESYLVPGLELSLFPDENDGYFENWAAPEPKVFVMWRMQDERAMPVVASVSYVEGTRMLDSGESADGVPMPADIHAWLGEYLQKHYQPRTGSGRAHG